jgi:hypothetical protein
MKKVGGKIRDVLNKFSMGFRDGRDLFKKHGKA